MEKHSILELLARNEVRVSELYHLYSEKHKKMHDFWHLLSDEEIHHATWLRDLAPYAMSGLLFIDVEQISQESIALFADYLNKKIKEAKEGDVALTEALGIALNIENSLIEKKWLDCIQTKSSQAMITLNRLKDDLLQHRNRVQAAFAQQR
jgi:hypothetical protein